jgi:uncharacterized membrane protein YgaE (UPF0421/DUF939 family)
MTIDKNTRRSLIVLAAVVAGLGLALIAAEILAPRPESRARGEHWIAIYALIGAGTGALVSLWAFAWTRLTSRAVPDQEDSADGD